MDTSSLSSFRSRIGPLLAAAYGLLAVAAFAIAIVYCPGFLGGFPVPQSALDGPLEPLPRALTIDVALIALFGLHHSVFARESVKRRLVGLLPESVERSTYVLMASLLLLAVYVFWRPLPAVVWSFAGPWRGLAMAAMAVGWLTSLVAARRLGCAELSGVRQALATTAPEPEPLRIDGLHGVVRHPIYLGFLLGVWCLPTMTVGHLVFATTTTAYLAVGVVFEERDLVRRFGDAYRAYRARVPAVVPGFHLRPTLWPGLVRSRSLAG